MQVLMIDKLFHLSLILNTKITWVSTWVARSLRQTKCWHFCWLNEQDGNQLQNWKTANISTAGRVALIQIHIESMAPHTMQCFQLPSLTSEKIDQISRNFFWKKSDAKKGLPMISWDKIFRPKQSRGFGLRKTEAVNSAFLSKLTWKLFNKQCL